MSSSTTVPAEVIRLVTLKKKLVSKIGNRYPSSMSSQDEKTERMTIKDLREASVDTMRTSKLPAVSGDTLTVRDLQSQNTVSRKVPEMLLSSVKKTRPMQAIADISTALLERLDPEEDLDSTQEIPRLKTEIQKAEERTAQKQTIEKKVNEGLEFSASIDDSGRIQLPVVFLTDPRVKPGRKMKIRIEFEDDS